ncbi:hypothetical protein [Haladaptatus sp. DJG-WS-42]|uniref:hypothetical protein n=1 Tax=Haladaptatus sp. DJG-WS-42 TaxID=3120516 RepID=UPI0030D18C74
MSVSGTCQLCGTREITDDCGRCGKLVCATHYDDSFGYCTNCVTEIRGAKEPTSTPEEDEFSDGVDTFRS